VGSTVVNNEDEAALRVMSIAPMPSGGSRLATMGNDGRVHIVTLTAADQVTGSPVSLVAADFQDLYADDAGGVVLLARPAQGSGTTACGTLTNLCGPSGSLPSQYACYDMYLVRFDGTTETWASKLSGSSSASPPYLNSPTDSQDVVFIWQAYAHHGRIAFDGTNYAGYYGAAISVSQTCTDPQSTLSTGVNIHQGDQMKVVGPSGGAPLSGHNSFDWGCSHSGYERMIWDAAGNKFVTVCKTDNNNRIAFAPTYTTILSVDLWYNNLGDLVTGSSGGYWLTGSMIRSGQPANSNGLADVRLIHFTSGAPDVNVLVANDSGLNVRAPHLAAYGASHLLSAYETSTRTGDLPSSDTTRKLYVQAHDRATGAAVGDRVEIAAKGNRYQEFVGFPDGSVAYAAQGSTNTRVKIVRVLPCGT